MKRVKSVCSLFLMICLTIGMLAAEPVEAAVVSARFTVRYVQTDARSELAMINAFRTGSEAWIWNESNTEKVQYSNLSPLTYDYELEKVAMQRCAEIAMSYGHDRPDGSVTWEAHSEMGYTSWTSLGENIAAGQTSAKAVFTAWREDDKPYSGQGHRRNMLSSGFNRVGCAGCYYNGVYYWVQEFATSSAAVGPAAANDSSTQVNVNFERSKATITITPSKSTVDLQLGETTAVPSATLKIRMPGTFGHNGVIPENMIPAVTVKDSSIVQLSGGILKAVGTGTTTLQYAALGVTVTVPVSVGHTHTWDDGTVTTEATCTDTGVCTYKCSVCGGTKTETISALGHDFVNGKVQEQATCEKDGRMVYTCSRCDVTAYQIIPATGHSYTSKVTAPTCTAEGYTTHTCSNCGNSYVDSKVAAKGHSWNSGTVTKAATCTEAGVKTYTCNTCKATKTETIAATGHSYSSKVVAPTCTEKGYTLHTCSKCNTSYKDTYVNAKGHSWNSGTVTKAATCTEAGVKTYTCNTCKATKTETIAATGHSYVVTVTPGACTSGGTKTSKCSNCGDTIVETIPATGHSYSSKMVAPTCTEKGYTLHTCSKCNTSYKDTYVNAKGHSWNSGTVTKAATCTEAGVKTYTCNTCKATKTETIAATGHSYTSKVTEPGCSSEGYTTHTCSKCGNSYVDSKVAAKGHSWDEGTITLEPTTTSTGIKRYKCTVCGKTKDETIPKKTAEQPVYEDGFVKTAEGWVVLKNGQIDTSFTGMAKNQYGWYYVSKGRLDLTFTGMAKNQYGWWYMKNGKLDQTYTGMAKNDYGWWYMTKGKLDLTYTGLAKNQYGWWYMTKGKLDKSFTGMAKNQYGWWVVINGKLDATFCGIARNDYGWWYFDNGKIATYYTGYIMLDNGEIVYVKAGKVM